MINLRFGRWKFLTVALTAVWFTAAGCSNQASYYPDRMLGLAQGAELKARDAKQTQEALEASRRDLSGEVENILTDTVEAEDKAALGAGKIAPRPATPKKSKSKHGK